MTALALLSVRRRWSSLGASDRGSMIPMIALTFVIGAMMVFGSTAAGSAFLAQRDLQSTCDGAAVAGAQSVDASGFLSDGGGSSSGGETLPLNQVQAAVSDYVAAGPTDDQSAVSGAAVLTDGGQGVRVVCRTTVQIPFGGLFGFGGGLDRTATADAQSIEDQQARAQ